ncbi:Hypothetical protein HVR_LOCUS423 [uncultured virus]|nr:Hypothetical protein HVR_LOCUS423 [uncultured virus]
MKYEDYVFDFCIKTIAPIPNDIKVYIYKSDSTPNEVIQEFLIYCLRSGITSDHLLYDQKGISPYDLKYYAMERADAVIFIDHDKKFIEAELPKFQRLNLYFYWSLDLLQKNYHILFFDFLEVTFYKDQPGQIPNIRQRYFQLFDNIRLQQRYLGTVKPEEDEPIEISGLFN